jgi:thiol-disulfide isomerase/thioredoxin
MRILLPLVCLALLLPLALLGPLTMQRADAEEVLKPTKAYGQFLKDMRPYSGVEKETEAKKWAEEYLSAWAASGQKPTPTDNYVLAQFQQAAEQYAKALAGFHAVQSDQEVKEKTRDYAAGAEAGLLLIPAVRSELGEAGIQKSLEGLAAYTAALPVPGSLKAQSTIRSTMALVYDMGGQVKEARALRMQLLKDDPGQLSSLVRPLVAGFTRTTHKLAEFDAVKADAAATIKTVRAMQQDVVNKAQGKYDKSLAKLKGSDPSALDGEGNLKKTSTKGMSPDEKAVYNDKRALATAQELLADIAEYEKPIALLGAPAAAWTLEKAFGELESLTLDSLKGKVVVLDFWATMFDHCNFPLMRDLVKAYGEKGLAAVGVTITGGVVYADRFPMDEDMKSKAEPGAQLYYAAMLATEDRPADGDYILNEAEYRVREAEAIEAFIAAHELTWPQVMIAKNEPAEKYAEAGWPHLLVLDKEGRIRFFRSGELSRADKEGNAALRTIIEDLLAE